MAERYRLIAELTNLTPLYLGDAEQRCELRPPAVKGPLRFWYRAIDPEFRDHEPRFFGGRGEGAGQAPFALRLRGPSEEAAFGPEWPEGEVRRFDDTRFGGGRKTRNGVKYLGFPFASKDHRSRNWLRPGARLRLQADVLRAIPKSADGERFRRALVASIWLLCHFGGLGSRSRRGFGSLHLTAWTVQVPGRGGVDGWPELAALPLLHSARSEGEWIRDAERAITTMRDWFKEFDARSVRHPFLGPRYRLLVAGGIPAQEQAAPPARRPGPPGRESAPGARPTSGWMAALNNLGRMMQDFRVRAAPDYQSVKDHLTGARRLTTLPERATFGLPIAFAYSEVRDRATFVPYDRDAAERGEPLERHPSLLLARLVRLGTNLHPAFIRLDGPTPGVEGKPGAVRGQRLPLSPPGPGARTTMDAFLAHLTGGGRR